MIVLIARVSLLDGAASSSAGTISRHPCERPARMCEGRSNARTLRRRGPRRIAARGHAGRRRHPGRQPDRQPRRRGRRRRADASAAARRSRAGRSKATFTAVQYGAPDFLTAADAHAPRRRRELLRRRPGRRGSARRSQRDRRERAPRPRSTPAGDRRRSSALLGGYAGQDGHGDGHRDAPGRRGRAHWARHDARRR